MHLESASREQLEQWAGELEAEYASIKQDGLKLDLTRGKPSAEQLDLANALDGDLNGNYKAPDGTDARNYGGLDGLLSLRELAASWLDVPAAEVLAGGNSSLTLMYQAVQFAWCFGVGDNGRAWSQEDKVSFLCPSPGYDRHFAITEEFGINMIPVPINDDGPDMDAVERMISEDSSIRGMWCVPKYSNPTGCIYSEETVDRIARLGKTAADNFRVFWDNAYAFHDLNGFKPLASLRQKCLEHGTEDSVYQFSSTSKVSFAGAGVAFMSASDSNLRRFRKHLGIATIGPDKVNQLRHIRLFDSKDALFAHMQKHAALLQPKFAAVLDTLDTGFADSDMLSWTRPEGGYFVSVDTLPGLAREVVRLADEVGVKLTPAGATFPYGKDPQDNNIRLAPSFPSLAEVDATMKVFVTCVRLASVRSKLARLEQ